MYDMSVFIMFYNFSLSTVVHSMLWPGVALLIFVFSFVYFIVCGGRCGVSYYFLFFSVISSVTWNSRLLKCMLKGQKFFTDVDVKTGSLSIWSPVGTFSFLCFSVFVIVTVIASTVPRAVTVTALTVHVIVTLAE